jgi:hypothetical protein
MNNTLFYSFFWIFIAIFIVLYPPPVRSSDALPQRQQQLAERYVQLEHVLQRLAEASAASYPKNADLLKKTLNGSKDKLLASRLSKIAEALERSRFTDAVSEQETAEKDLLELLQILESADRQQRRDNEKERLKQLLRELDTITQQERLLKDKTQQIPKDAAEKLPAENLHNETLRKEQEQIRLKTQTLKDRLQADAANETAADKEAQTPSPIGEAAKKMQQAEEKLQKPDKNGAVEAQEDAVAELQKAKAELEERLRQMREEELIADLEKLEVRFKRMLQVEQGIRLQTEKIAAQSSSRQTKIEADRLASDQQTNMSEAETALIMLREHGTARAAAETLEQARFDMTEVQHRLKETQLDYLTIQMENSVIESLKELIDAVQSAREETAKRQDAQNAAGETASAAEDEPLIQLLAELRMIRTMQRRVNDRTALCNTEIEKLRQIPNADFSVLQKQVEELARQQNRISRILHDLKIGKAE